VDKNPVPDRQVLLDKAHGSIHYFIGDESGIGGINQVQDKAIPAPRYQILRVVFRGGSARVAQRLSVIGLFAGMNDRPTVLKSDIRFVGCLSADEQTRMHLDFCETYSSASTHVFTSWKAVVALQSSSFASPKTEPDRLGQQQCDPWRDLCRSSPNQEMRGRSRALFVWPC
jgi:hypothetical protein